MTTKGGIIEQIGETGLLLPELITRGLAANDRLKYYLTLLQAAVAHAQNPQTPAPNLRAEREACAVDDASLDDVVPTSRLAGDVVIIPGAQAVKERIIEGLSQMLAPIEAAAAGQAPDARQPADAFRRRLEALIAITPSFEDGRVAPDAIQALGRAGDVRFDSVHQLVMDLHQALNRLHADIAVESIDGARAFGLTDTDRRFVLAFMRGVNETAPLKFDHPGLGTTAARSGDRLSIQNDLGTTDAHVVVVNVVGLTATLIYTDIHRRRGQFLEELLEPFSVEWEGAADTSAGFEMRIGRFTAKSEAAIEHFLTFLGSRLVFLIDWNRARKRLARFVKKSEAAAILKWAADNNVGHRAFLQAGDTQLIYTALERAAPAQMRYGARLDEILGRDAARAFLTSVLSIVSHGLRAGRSLHLIQDEIEAELLTHLQTTDRSMLGAAADHAMLVAALADRLRRGLMRAKAHTLEDRARTAELAKTWETRADEIVRRTSRVSDDKTEGQQLHRLIGEADDAADALEEAVFLLTLLPEQADENAVTLLDTLGEVVARGAREYVRSIEDVRELARTRKRSDVGEFLISVDRLAALEHEADVIERAVTSRLMQAGGDYRTWHVLAEMTRGLEDAADSLARCGLILRDYVLTSQAPGR